MNTARWGLVASAVALIAFMLWCIPWATGTFGAAIGLAIAFALYWFAFCLPVGLAFQGQSEARRLLRVTTGQRRWAAYLAVAQVVLIGGASLVLMPHPAPLAAVGLALLFGAINGFCEEFFWRGAFLRLGPDDPAFQVLGLALFGFWHVPLYLAQGVVFEGGALGLIGGSLFLGAIWTFIAYKTKRIGLCVIAHCATNSITFIGFMAANFFG